MDDNKRKLYDALSQDYDMGTFEQFSNDIKDAGKRQKLYDAIKDDYDLPDFDGFTKQLGVGGISQEQIQNSLQQKMYPNGVKPTKPVNTPKAQPVQQPQRKQGNPLTNLRDKAGEKIVQGLDAIGAIEHQPAQQDQPQQGLQQAQIPQGFGQFNIQQANQMGAGRGPVSWEQPEPKEETVVNKQARMLQGKATPQEQKQVQSRMQQRKDEIAYKEETGKDLRQPVLNTEFEAPTVSRDEDGNILIGNTTDQDLASAHQQVMAEQAAWGSLSDKEKQEKMKQMQLEMEQNEYEEPGFLGVTGKKLGSGFIKAGLGLLNGMKALASGMIVEDASSPTGYSKTEDYDPTKNNDAINRGLEAANQYAERMSREGEPRKGAGFTDLLLDGDIGGFLLKGWGSALESAPMTLSIYNPYTMALNAISMAGNNFRENTIENPDIPVWKRASMAIGSAAIEQAVEKFSDPVFKYFNGGRILSWFGKKASEETSKKIAKEAESILARRIMGVIKDAAAEGAEEVVTNFGNDALGQALDWMDGEAEYGIVAQWKDYKKLHPNADLAGFAMQKAKENLDSFFGGALGGAYMSGSAQITAAGFEYATGHTVSPEQMANPTAPIHPATLDIAQSYDEGYTMNNEQEVANAKANYEAQRQRATEILGETKGLDENPTQTLQTMQDGLQDGSFTPEQVQAALDYVDAKATVDGIQQRIVEDNRANRHNFVANGNNIDEIDAQGNVVATHEYENADEMRTALWEMQAKREHDDVMTDINIAKTNPKYDYDGIIGAFAEETGLDVDYIESILNKDPLELEDPESAMVAEFAEILHNTIYGNTTVHTDQSTQDGANLADEMGIDLNNLSPAQVEQAQQITTDFSAAQQALNQAFAADENLQQEVARLENEGMPKQGIVSTLGELGFRPNQVQAVIDYYNAEAKFNGFKLQMANKINEAAANERQRHTLKGTIDGKADLNNVHTISDGTNEYFLVSGDITTDPATGRITGSGSGLIIGMDLDGSFVNISDTDGYSVMPVTQTLDQWEEAERIRLQEQMTATIDPTGSMMPQEQHTGEVGGEAGASTGTGANEPLTPESVPQNPEAVTNGEQPVPENVEMGTQQPVQIPVDEKSGLKRYEQGIPVEQAIQDIQNDGFDVNEMADAYINEAQEAIDKINNKAAKKPQDLIERKRLTDVITYYNNVKARYAELHPTYADAQPFIDQLNAATSKKKADEVLNAALQAGVNPQEIQPVHTQKVSDIITKEEEARKREDEITDRDMLLIRQYKDTPQGRSYLLDRKRVPSAEKRRKIAKLVYGDLFDDDFDAPRDIRELISMWLGKGRALDPDTFGQELGWDMGVGKDAAKVSTMFTARRENGGDGMLFNDFVHMVMEASGGRYTTEEIRNELIDMFQGAQEKADLTEYQLQSRALEAERQLQAEQARAEEAEEQPIETAEIPEGQLPFGPQPEDEERPAFLGEEEQQPAEESETEAQPEETQEESHQTESREQYLASHPLTEEQIMADTQANEDEKLTAIEYMKGEDDRAIAQFIYDTIYNRAQQVVDAEPSADALQTINETAAEFKREQQKAQDQKDIDAALKEFNDFLDNAKGSGVVDKFIRKGVEGNDKLQSNLFDAFTMTNAAQRAFLGDLLRLASKVGYAYIKSGVHDVQAWSKQMADSIGRKLKDVLGWDDSLIDDFIGEVWEQKYTVDGQRMKLREHAEKLKNNKEADQAVNVNKNENNEPENSVSLQQEAAKPAEELEGDSAEFADSQKNIENFKYAVRGYLFDAVVKGDIKLKTMQSVKALAKEHGLDDMSMTDLQELVEAEIVDLARDFAVTEALNDWQKFENIRRLYEFQPTLSARDNDRINKQQYSTPAPMAYLMGQFVTAGKPMSADARGLEPSAGNGMLTIALPKEQMHVNDIDEMRLDNLAAQGFGEVTSQDGTQPFEPKAYDVIVTNPPFGTTVPKVYDGIYEISALEHQMAINALESMKDDGRAAIIIGGNTEYKTNGAVQGKDRIFLNYLYSHYNVVDVINLDGKTLYSKQGTGYPVRMILINGRKEFDPQSYAPVKSKARAEQVKSYDELYNRVNDDILSNANQPASVHDTESGESRRVDDSRHGEESTQTGVRNVQSEGRKGQSSERSANGRSVRGVSGNAQSEERGNTVGEGSGMVDGTTTVLHGSRPETSESNGTATEPAREQRPESGGNDTERPVAGADNSERVGQRGAESSQSVQQPEQQRGLSTEKVPYKKQSSNPFTLQSLMPAEQADEVKKILEELGDVDQFLIDELGYSNKEELHKALAAEQIDSVAMAINQMNQGNAFIIGDQTGIGKGRQAAALIRYGVKKGGFPVFITVKKALFSDMYRDLCDIGSPKLRPFIWSADDAQHSGNVTDKDGNVIYQMPSPKEKKRVVEYINKYGKLPKEYDYVLTTYDSFKSGTMDYEGDKKSPRKFPKGKSAGAVHVNGQANRDALETLAANSFVIMDESHNAGGEGSNVSNYLQYITTKAKGITFLSATFAKRPGNMPIYSLKTAIAKAGVKVEELIDAVKRGGATFQEIMSKALTGAGQMIRRERDMTGVTIDWRGIEDEAVIEQQREQYDKIIGLFNDIIDFQRTYIDPIIDQLNDEAADAQGEVDHTPGTRDMGINNTPFASRTYNMVQQVLLSLKAEEAAKRAIEHLKLGRKPVITVANTNEGAADSVAATDGESMEMPDLGVNLKKGLQGTLRIQKKDANNDTTQTMIPLERLPEEARQRYAEIMDAIENSSSGLSLSPIDVIKNELKKAGYKVGELTGRQAEFVYNEDGTVRRVRRQDTDKKKVAADFNNGKLDALILNRSAGTGISLHASTKFKDQRQRIMIVAQAQGDVNDEVQIRGRIDRTGQVLRGMYEYVVSQIPSEQRLLMMLKAKLRSLDANTTSSQKSKFNEMQVQDIMNKYGDQIVVQYLAENPEIYAKLADPLKWGDSVFVTPPEALVESANRKQGDGATASMILGRMALLKVAEQEKMLDDLSALYQAEIDRLNEMGENDLEITEMPLKAKTLSKQVWEQGVDPDGKNPFADNTYVEKVNMDVLKKPMKASEVKASQERLLDGKTWEEFKQSVMEKVDAWAEQKKEETTATITERAKKKAAAEQERYVKGAKKAQEKNGMTDEEIERNGNAQYNTFYKQEMEKLNDAIAAIEAQKQVFVDALETFNTDDVYAMPSNIYDISGMTFEPGIGKLIDIKITDNMSPNASTLSFATLDGRRKITIPINGKVKQQKGEKAQIFPTITSLTAQAKSGWFGQNIANTIKVLGQNLDNWDKLTSSAARKDGYIITGNLLKALVSTREQGVGGKLISYTTDTGEVRQGILMPDNFEPAGLTSKTPISAKKDELKYNRDKVTSADGEVTVQVTNDWDWDTRSYNTLELIVPKSTKRGGKYFNDETLLKLMRDQFEGSTKMKAEFKRENLDAVMKRLDELGVTVKEEHNEDAKRMITSHDPMEAISQAAEDWRQERKASPSISQKAKEVTDFINGMQKRFGIKGGSKTYVINSVDDIEALRGTLSDSAIDVITNEYNEPDVPAAYLVTSNVVVIFGEKVDDVKDAEVAYWHEQAHSFWSTLPEDVRNIFGEACLNYLERNYPLVYRHIKDKYSEDVWLEEACSFLMGEVVAENGTAKLLNDNFAGNEIICNFANGLRNYIKYGKQNRNNQLRRNEVGQDSEISRRSETGQGREGSSLRPEEEQITDPIEAIEQSAKRWKKSRREQVEGIEEINKYSAKEVYHERINRAESVMTEAFQDDMVTFKNGQNAIAHDKEVPDSQNAYQAANLAYGKTFNEQEQFTNIYRTPLEETILAIMRKMGWQTGDVDRYLFTKHGLERNRELFVRDWFKEARNRELEQEEKDQLDDLENEYVELKQENYQKLMAGDMTFAEYLNALDSFIRDNIDSRFDAEKSDYSGFTEMFGDEDGNFNEAEILANLSEQEEAIGKELLDQMWKKVNLCSQLGLTKYRDTGMMSEDTYKRVTNMFHWYVPMRGWSESEAAQDHWQYMTVKEGTGTVGGLLKHAAGRKSEAGFPLATLFSMTYKAISDGNQNVVKQHFYRLCQANPNDLVITTDTWAVMDETTGEWTVAYPDINSDMSPQLVEQKTIEFDKRMKQLQAEGKAKKVKGNARFDYKIDKTRQREHIVEVMINGQRKMMVVTGNPRMAQAINGQLRYERGKGKWNQFVGSVKQFQQTVSTSYNLTFLGRNMARDWTHFGALLTAREGAGYMKAAQEYYFEQMPKMVSLFKKYREGTLDMSNEMERDFKDFMDNGGITGFVQMQKVEELQKDIQRMLSDKGKVKKIGNAFFDKTLGAVQAMNEAIENNARFATYRASRHYAGRTKARSAYDAKEVTVNFNKKGAGRKTSDFKSDNKRVQQAATIAGETSQILMANKMFFNATMQAICNIFRGLKNPDGSINYKYAGKLASIYAAPPFAMGLLMPVINAALLSLAGGDDGDDPYANLPEWVRRKNLCIYTGWATGNKNDFLVIPMGQELAAFYSMGDMMAGITYREDLKPIDKTLFDEMVGFLNVFSPVDFESKVTNEFSPVSEFVGRICSPVAPLVAIGENIGWTGKPIYRRDKYQGDEYTPEYQMTLGNTNSAYISLSKWLNDVSGGDDVHRGALQVNPSAMQYLFEQYIGGPGKFFMNTGSAVGDAYKWAFTDEEPDFNIRKIEFFRAFWQQGDERTELYRTQAKYRRYQQEANEFYHDFHGYEKDATTNPDHYMKAMEMSQDKGYIRMQMVKEADKTLKKLNTAANQASGRERKNLRALYNNALLQVVNDLDKVQNIE